eukprot:3456169-Rhodomonas_salina.5
MIRVPVGTNCASPTNSFIAPGSSIARHVTHSTRAPYIPRNRRRKLEIEISSQLVSQTVSDCGMLVPVASSITLADLRSAESAISSVDLYARWYVSTGHLVARA